MYNNYAELFHTGFLEIREPDITVGRKNADFGQGFYLSNDMAFSKRWARERSGKTTCMNRYEMSYDGLQVLHLVRDERWFKYIRRNRAGYEDELSAYDVIIGPIANDTIYDTGGILTSGVLSPEDSLEILKLGPVYEQIVIKSKKAVEALAFRDAVTIGSEEIAGYRELIRAEEAAFREQLAKFLENI